MRRCDRCGETEAWEHLVEVYRTRGSDERIRACRRCRMPASRRGLWDELVEAEQGVMRAPDDTAALQTLRRAREAWDRR